METSYLREEVFGRLLQLISREPPVMVVVIPPVQQWGQPRPQALRVPAMTWSFLSRKKLSSQAQPQRYVAIFSSQKKNINMLFASSMESNGEH
eukprot:scaffold136361_cov31-Prasinocladus_malaysianus.AAC.1